jgi:hypothetical protein
MADTKTPNQRDMKEKNPQVPQENPQRQWQNRPEEGKQKGNAEKTGVEPEEKSDPGDQKRGAQQHHEKQQGQKMPQQQKHDNKGDCCD